MRRVLLLLAVVLLLGVGCGGVPTGPVSPPEYYPDRTSHTNALRTFFWAWHEGDVDVLAVVLGAWLHRELEERLEKEDKAAVAAWYRRGAEDLSVDEIEWRDEGEALAYARVVLRTAGKRLELDFSMLRRPDGWVVSGKRPLR